MRPLTARRARYQGRGARRQTLGRVVPLLDELFEDTTIDISGRGPNGLIHGL